MSMLKKKDCQDVGIKSDIFVILGIVSFVLTQPTAFGEKLNILGVGGILSSTIVYAFIRRQKYTLNSYNIYTTFFMFTWLFLLIVSAVVGAGGLGHAVGPSLSCVSSAIFAFVVLGERRGATRFFDKLSLLLLILSLSAICTALLSLFLRPYEITYAYFDYSNGIGYAKPVGDIMFPFSMRYADENESIAIGIFRNLPRLSLGFREAGIAPPFLCWAATYRVFRGRPIYELSIFVLAILTTFSTLAVPLAALTIFACLIGRFRIPPGLALAAGLVIAPVGLTAYKSLPVFGLQSKVKNNNVSYSERERAISTTMSAENIVVGSGLGQDTNAARNTIGINLLSSVASIGLMGVTLIVVFYFIPIFRPVYFLGALAPMVITSLFSQPISSAPFSCVLFFSVFVVGAPQSAGLMRPPQTRFPMLFRGRRTSVPTVQNWRRS